MGSRVSHYIDLATKTLAYLKALDPWFPNPDGADGEARVLAWADAFASQDLNWGEIKASVDTFTTNAPSGAHAGIQDVIRGVRAHRAHLKLRNNAILAGKRPKLAQKAATAPVESCYTIHGAINISCPECGAPTGGFCTNGGDDLHAPHMKRLLLAKKTQNNQHLRRETA